MRHQTCATRATAIIFCSALLLAVQLAAKPLTVPFEFPAVPADAKAGETILVPAYKALQEVAAKGPDKARVVFYHQTLTEPGERASMVGYRGGEQAVPNLYFVPIPDSQKAEVGDTLLTYWQSGSGMQRARVVEADDPTRPVVRYLDIKWENPAKRAGVPLAQIEDQLAPGSFAVLEQELQPGTSAACRQSASKLARLTVIRIAADKLLGLGFAGKLEVYDLSGCRPVPIAPEIAGGNQVLVDHFGFRDGRVTRVDPRIGRVWVEVEFGGKIREIVASFGDILIHPKPR